MDKVQAGSYIDFYFNGHWISEFGGFVGGQSGLKEYSLLPTRKTTTVSTIFRDGESVVQTKLGNRTISIPVFFTDLSEVGLRKIANWLYTQSPTPLYFEGEDIYLNCMLDDSVVNLSTIIGVDGSCVLSFIAYDPFYYGETVEKTFSTLVTTESDNMWLIRNNTIYDISTGCNTTIYPIITVQSGQNSPLRIIINSRAYSGTLILNNPASEQGWTIDCNTRDITNGRGLYISDNQWSFTGENGGFMQIPSNACTIQFSGIESEKTNIVKVSYQKRDI